MMSEPLSLLVLMSGMLVSILSPAFHYHQFGEPTRMARDAGLSSVLLATSVFAVFGVIRSFRREMETGTASVAVAISVSRVGFFLAKTLGGFLASAVFFLAIFANALTVVNGARIGGEISAETGALARIWGPSLCLALATAVLPGVIAAALNRFLRMRFCLTAFVLSVVLACASVFYRFDADLFVRLFPVYLVAASVPAVLVSAAAVGGALMRANAAGSFVGVVALVLVPFAGNHCLSDSLSDGGSADAFVVLVALASAVFACLAFAVYGAAAMRERDLS